MRFLYWFLYCWFTFIMPIKKKTTFSVNTYRIHWNVLVYAGPLIVPLVLAGWLQSCGHRIQSPCWVITETLPGQHGWSFISPDIAFRAWIHCFLTISGSTILNFIYMNVLSSTCGSYVEASLTRLTQDAVWTAVQGPYSEGWEGSCEVG